MEDMLRLLSYFTKFMKCDQSFMFYWFLSDSGYHSNTSILHFVLNNVVVLQNTVRQCNVTFKFCSTHVSLAVDEVSRKIVRRFSSKSKTIFEAS